MVKPNFRKMYNKFKKKKQKKVQPTKKIDKQQSYEIKKLKKQVALMMSDQEPYRIRQAIPISGRNGCRGVDHAYHCQQIRLTKHDFFRQKGALDTVIDEARYRQGNQLNIGSINFKLTLYDINYSFRWRLIILQYKERLDLGRNDAIGQTNYDTDGELDDLLHEYSAPHPDGLSSIERLNHNMVSYINLVKDRAQATHILYDGTFTGVGRSIKITGCDNQIKTYDIVVKPKMKTLTFENPTDTSPIRGDIVAYLYNDYPYSGARDYGLNGLDQTDHPEKFKYASVFYKMNVYDDN